METKTPEEQTADAKTSDNKDSNVDKTEKVQLDIEDAPFLSDTGEKEAGSAGDALEEKKSKSEEFDTSVLTKDTEEEPQNNTKKKLIFIIISVVILTILFVVIWFLFFSSGPVEEEVTESPTIIVVPSAKSIEGPIEYKIIFAPFMIEDRTPTTVRFLQATFTGISKSEKVIKESQSKELVLRDAIYYYLRNKDHTYLIDPENTIEIKQDLLDIVNGYLSSGKMEDILLENYILK